MVWLGLKLENGLFSQTKINAKRWIYLESVGENFHQSGRYFIRNNYPALNYIYCYLHGYLKEVIKGMECASTDVIVGMYCQYCIRGDVPICFLFAFFAAKFTVIQALYFFYLVPHLISYQ